VNSPGWDEIEALLDAVIDLPPAERAEVLDDPASGPPDVRIEVWRLLESGDAAERFFSGSAADFAAPLLARDLATGAGTSQPDRVGPYRIVGETGRGGMGAVYLAERDDDQYRMRVALKLVQLEMDSEHAQRRFREERQILASLQHPHIARLLDGGVTDEGRPYFAMEFVEGRPITEHCDALALGVEQRLEIFCTVCEAVQYAHRNLVVHRDLKPANILVDRDGGVKLLDFGVAKLLDGGSEAEARPATGTGLRLMTPAYASPEQVRAEPITTASDIYSLGVLLYELLAGRRPYAVPDSSLLEIEHAICDADPPPPSSVADDRLRRRLRGDLDTIILKALRKEPARRYASAEQLADDLRRHLAGLPVEARADTFAYRSSRFVRRNRMAVVAAALIVLALAGGLVGTAWQARDAARQAQRAEAVREFVVSLFQVSDPAFARGDEITARELLDRGAERIEVELARQPRARAEMLGVLGVIYRDLGIFERAEPLLRQSHDLRSFLYGERHPESAAAAHELGLLLAQMGRFDDAEELHRRALEPRRSGREVDGLAVARTLSALGAVLGRKAEYDEAEELHRRALALQLRHLGEESADVAETLDNLSMLLRARGVTGEAEAVQRRALAIRERVLGPDHLATATSTNNLALLLGDRGELEEAEELYRRVLDFDLRRLGEEHPYTATVMNNLAAVLRRREVFDEAEQLYRRSLAINRGLYGETHPMVATVLNNLGHVLRDRGDHEEAERLYVEALETFRAVHGEQHPSVGTAHAVLATAVHLRGDAAGAERLYRQGLEILRPAFPEGHSRTASALSGLGRLLVAEGRPDEGVALLREALEILTRLHGQDDKRAAAARAELESALAAGAR